LKQAARALVRVYFEEPSEQGDGTVEGVYLGSINEALNYLMVRGLGRVVI
jgi:hypothetical protein